MNFIMDSQGMKNAKKMLEKFGWSEGKGLGLNNDGIAEALNPSKKCDFSGIGHTKCNNFQWWDHAFNKAAQAFDIKITDDKEVVLVKTKEMGKIKTKRGISNLDQNNLAYGAFHKSGTLNNGVVVVESTKNTFELVEETDYSVKLSDEELFKLCNGLTAHKGARHGLTASGKLARIALQEAAMLESLNTNSTKISEKPEERKKKKRNTTEIILNENIKQTTDKASEIVCTPHSEDMIILSERSTKSKKNKRSREEIECVTDEKDIQRADETSCHISKKNEKTKKENKGSENRTELLMSEPIEESFQEPRKKRKKVKATETEAQQLEIEESIQQTCEKPKKKKKKKNRDRFDS